MQQSAAHPEQPEFRLRFKALTRDECELFALALESFAREPDIDHEPVFGDIPTDANIAKALAWNIRNQAGILQAGTDGTDGTG